MQYAIYCKDGKCEPQYLNISILQEYDCIKGQ